ncbi:hypothetical protein [Vallitalea okinawensis]|uniref:hypothetical protein n=1 Tax=Vallitalea okinawensis TaxID=2078660 RepID=UPI000CFC0589|nr:hypothetical protein [Vallitalea okinawensis]
MKTRKRRSGLYIYLVLLLCIIIFALCFMLFYNYGLKNARPEDENLPLPKTAVESKEDPIEDPVVINSEPHVDDREQYEEVTTDYDRVKSSTEIIFRTYYTLDNSQKEESVPPTFDMIGMTKEQVEAKFPDWQMIVFTSQKIVFERVENDTNKEEEKYIIKNINGYIGVLNLDGTVRETTSTPVSTLPPEEQEKLNKGMTVNKEKMIKLLQDYTS